MKTTLVSTLLVVLLAVLTPNQVWAQANRGSTKGEVRDRQQAEVPGIRMTLKNEATGASGVSEGSGQFNFLTALAKEFGTSAQQHIAIDAGRTRWISKS